VVGGVYKAGALSGTPSQSYRVSLVIWDPITQGYLPPDTSERARQAGTRFTYPGGMEG